MKAKFRIQNLKAVASYFEIFCCVKRNRIQCHIYEVSFLLNLNLNMIKKTPAVYRNVEQT